MTETTAMTDEQKIRVEWSKRKRWFTVRVWCSDGQRRRVPIPTARSEAEAIEHAPIVAEAARAAPVETWTRSSKEVRSTVEQTPKTAKIGPTVAAYALEWIASQTYDSADGDRSILERYLSPSKLGAMAIADVRPRHVVEFVRWLKAHPSARGGTLAPRTVRTAADVVRRAFNAAIVDELRDGNPFDPVRRELPSIADKDANAREGWEFTWDEVATMVYSPLIAPDRRVWYALAFGTGMRPGEAATLRWRDWDRSAQPLTRLRISRARKHTSRTEGPTKTGAVKACPIVAPLATILEAWRTAGWREFIGRDPMPDDLVVPNRNNRPRAQGRVLVAFKRDLARLRLRDRHAYVTRHTFVTRVQDDGGDPTIVRWVTHAPPKTAFDGYTRAQWTRLCAEVAKLRFPTALPSHPRSEESGPSGPERNSSESLEKESGREDLNAPPATDPPAIYAPSADLDRATSDEPGPHGDASERNRPDCGPTRDALVAAMVSATLAGQHEVAAVYARELQRLDGAVSNVVPLTRRNRP